MGLAVLARDGLAELVEVLLDELAIPEENAGTLDRRGVAPGREGGVRGLDRGIDLVGAARRTLGDDVAGGRIVDGRAADLGREPFAVDEERARSERRRS